MPTPLFVLPHGPWEEYKEEDWEAVYLLLDARAAANVYGWMKGVSDALGVAKSTLHGWYSARRLSGHGERGPAPRLIYKGVNWDQKIADHVMMAHEMSCPLNTAEVCRMAASLAKLFKLPHSVVGGGKHWLSGWRHRYPELVLRTAESVERARGLGMTREAVAHFYENLSAAYASLPGLTPDRVYNMDETGLDTFNARGPKTFARRGARSPKHVTPGTRSHITAVVCGDAAGHLLPTLLLLPKSIEGSADLTGAHGALIRFEKSTYMTEELWVAWVNMFVETTGGNCVLVVDQHRTRLSLFGLYLLAKANVRLVLLPAHTTDHLQPLDVSVFSAFKAALGKLIKELGLDVTNAAGAIMEALATSTAITKPAFTTTTKQAKSTVISGFKATGIWPLNPDAMGDKRFKYADAYERDLNKKVAEALATGGVTGAEEDADSDDGSSSAGSGDGDDDGDDDGILEEATNLFTYKPGTLARVKDVVKMINGGKMPEPSKLPTVEEVLLKRTAELEAKEVAKVQAAASKVEKTRLREEKKVAMEAEKVRKAAAREAKLAERDAALAAKTLAQAAKKRRAAKEAKVSTTIKKAHKPKDTPSTSKHTHHRAASLAPHTAPTTEAPASGSKRRAATAAVGDAAKRAKHYTNDDYVYG